METLSHHWVKKVAKTLPVVSLVFTFAGCGLSSTPAGGDIPPGTTVTPIPTESVSQINLTCESGKRVQVNLARLQRTGNNLGYGYDYDAIKKLHDDLSTNPNAGTHQDDIIPIKTNPTQNGQITITFIKDTYGEAVKVSATEKKLNKIDPLSGKTCELVITGVLQKLTPIPAPPAISSVSRYKINPTSGEMSYFKKHPPTTGMRRR